MKNRLLIMMILVNAIIQTTPAQQVLKPAEPNDVCLSAWQNYRKADVLWKTGWGLFGGGLGLAGAGMLVWAATPREHSVLPGFSIMCVGIGATFASIPCLAVGQVRRKAAMATYYDNNCSPETCADIKINYKKANTLWKTGWGLFGGGLGLALGGGILWGCTLYHHHGSYENYPMATANLTGFYTMIAGAGITAASIPCLAVGQVRRKAAMNMYKERGCQQEQPLVQFSIQTSSNGLGLAMHF